jgi:hypothetical protein
MTGIPSGIDKGALRKTGRSGVACSAVLCRRDDESMRNRFSALRYIETPVDIGVPVIDDVPLFERLPERYPGLALNLVVPPSLQWLGVPTYAEGSELPPRYRPSNASLGEIVRAVILDGTCGTASCCGVMARIDVSATRVVWSNFLARGSPPIPAGLRFEFDRDEYEAALVALPNQPRVEWTDSLD